MAASSGRQNQRPTEATKKLSNIAVTQEHLRSSGIKRKRRKSHQQEAKTTSPLKYQLIYSQSKRSPPSLPHLIIET
jgi:hypothetical protein